MKEPVQLPGDVSCEDCGIKQSRRYISGIYAAMDSVIAAVASLPAVRYLQENGVNTAVQLKTYNNKTTFKKWSN
jgi:hypothetical protein